jgi:hypothetical protein
MLAHYHDGQREGHRQTSPTGPHRRLQKDMPINTARGDSRVWWPTCQRQPEIG